MVVRQWSTIVLSATSPAAAITLLPRRAADIWRFCAPIDEFLGQYTEPTASP
jgi:hypothetical protein